METCPRCEGSGWSRDAILLRQEPCDKCVGTGKVKIDEDPKSKRKLEELMSWSEVDFYNGA